MSVGELVVSITGDMSKLSTAFSKVNSEIGTVGNSFTSFGSKLGSTVGSGLTTVATAAAVTGTALGVGLVAAGSKSLSMFNDFETSVSNAASVTGLAGDAFAAAKENISAVAQELGQKTAFSSSQAADALYNLASAGVDVSQITANQLVPVLNLASGTQYDLADTTAAVTSTLSQFGLGFEEAGRVADVFAKDAGLTQASMDKLSLSMNYVGTVANTTGISFENTSAALGVLYNAGMDGSTAGTSLRGVIASLVAPSGNAASALNAMGLTVADVSPTTHNFNDIIQTLADKGLNATQAFEIFGRESAPAILALTSKAGDLKTLTGELENAGGAAQTMADQQLDTLTGSLDALSGSIENMFINIGGALAPTFRSIVDYINSLIPAIQTFVVGLVQGFVDIAVKLKAPAASIYHTIQSISGYITDIISKVFSGDGLGTADGIINWITKAVSQMGSAIISAMPAIQSAIFGIVDFFRSLVTGLAPTYNNIKTIIGNIINVFKEFFSGISSSVSSSGAASAISGTVNTISGILAKLSTVISGALIKVIPVIKNVLGSIVNAVQNVDWGGIFNRVKAVFDSGVQAIKGAFEKLAPIVPIIKGVFENIKNAFVFGYNAIKTGDWTGLFNGIKTAFSNGLDAIKNINWQGILDKIKEVFEGIKNKVLEVDWNGIFDKVKTAFIEGKDKILNIVWDAIPDKIKETFEKVKTAISDVVNALQPTWDNLKASFESIKDIIEIFRPSFDSLVQSLSDNKGAAGATALSIALGAVKLAVEALVVGLNLITGIIKTVLEFFAEHPTITKFAATLLVAAAGVTALGAVITAITAFFAPVIAGIVTLGTTLATVGAGATLAAMFPGLAGIWAAFTVGFGIVSSAVSGIISVIGMIATPFGLVIAALAIFALAWRNNWFDIQGKLEAAKTAIITAATNLYNTLHLTWNGLIMAAGTLKTNLKTIWDVITASFEASKTLIVNTVTGLYNGLVSAYNSISTSLSTFKTNALARWAEIKAGIVTYLNGIISDAQTWINNHVAKLNAHITQIGVFKTQALAKWNEIKAGILTKLNELINDVQSWIQKQVNKYNDAVAKINQFKTQVLAKWAEIKAGILAKLNELIADAQNWITKQLAKYNDAIAKLSNFKTQALARWTEIKAGILAKLNEIISDAQSWITKQVAKLNDMVSKYNTFKTQVITKWTEIKTAIKTKLDEIVTEIKNKVAPIGNAVDSIVTKIKDKVSDFKAAGKAIMQGLIDGIEDKIKKIKDTINSVNTWIDNHMPHSPAKEGVFRRLPNWDAVFVDPVQSSLVKMNDLTGPISNTLSNIKSPLNEATSIGLSNIQNTSNAYTNAATSYGDTTINVGPVSLSNNVDIDTLVAKINQISADQRRQRGVFL